MKRAYGWSSVFLAFAWAAGAGEATVESLKEQRTALAADMKDNDAKLQKRRKELEKSVEMAAASADVDKAAKNLAKALADDPDLKAARAALAEARKGLDAAVSGAAGGSDDAKALDIQLSELEAKRAGLQFQYRLLTLQLTHGSSPARAEAEADAAVKKARQACADMEAEVREKPTPEVTAAAMALGSVAQKDFEIWKKLVSDNRELKSASAEEKVAREAMLKAQAEDKRQADLAAARKALEDARAEGFRSIAAAKPLLAEVAKLDKEVAAVESNRRAAREMRNMFNERVRDCSDRSVSKARDALAEAEKAYDAACPADVRGLGAARKAAWDAYESKAQEVWKAQEYKDLADRQAAAEKDVELLKEKLLAGKPVMREMTAAFRARDEAMQKMRERKKEVQGGEAQEEEINRLHDAFLGAKAGHLASVEAAPGLKRLRDVAEAARKALDSAVSVRLQTWEEAQPVRALIDDLAALRRGQDYRLAVLKFRLHDAMSPMAQAVAQQPDVAAAAAKVDDIVKAMRESPPDSVVKAEKAYAESRAKREKIEGDLRQDTSYAKALQARQAAEKALREAQAADPRVKAAAEARDAAERLVSEKIRAVPSGAPIAAGIEKVQRDLAAAEKAIRAVGEKKNEVRRAAERGDNPKVALAKKAVSDAEAALRAAEQSEKIAGLRKAAEDSRRVRELRLKELADKDRDCLKFADDLRVGAETDKGLVEQIKALEKKTGAPGALSPAATPSR